MLVPAVATIATGVSAVPLLPSQATGLGAAVIEIFDTTLTASSDLVFVIGSQTLLPGSTAITISSTPVSLAPSTVAIVTGPRLFL